MPDFSYLYPLVIKLGNAAMRDLSNKPDLMTTFWQRYSHWNGHWVRWVTFEKCCFSIDFPLRKLYQIVINNGYTTNWLPLNVFLRPPGDLLCFERYCPLAVGCLSVRAALGLLRWSLFVGLAKYRDVGLGVPTQLAVLHPYSWRDS